MPTARISNLDREKLGSIMRAAITEFSSSSYEQASFNRIIRMSGLSKGSLYYYFNSKEDLFLTLMGHCLEQLEARLVPEPITGGTRQFWAETKRLLCLSFELFLEERDLGAFMQMILAEDHRNPSSPAVAFLGELNDWLAKFLSVGQEVGAVRVDLSVELMTQMVWSLWRTAGKWFLTHPEEPAKAASMMTNFLARLLMPGASQS